MKDTKIIVNLNVEGIHYWADCPLEEVSFLKYPHRHMFHIELQKRVSHNDRDIEIIMLKRDIKNYLGNEPINFEGRSCEMIAEDLLNKFEACYVKVLEDGENGAVVEL